MLSVAIGAGFEASWHYLARRPQTRVLVRLSGRNGLNGTLGEEIAGHVCPIVANHSSRIWIFIVMDE